MSLYIIAIGGTGAKFAEAVIHLAAIGIFSEVDTIKILFVDPDESNGNLTRAKKTTASYQKCQSLITSKSRSKDSSDVPWMIPKIELFEPKVWSPLAGKDNKNLSSLFNYGNYREDDPIKGLFDTLFTKDERELSLEMGFRGRPAIGSAVMSQLDLNSNMLEESEPWITLFNQIDADVGGSGKDITVCLCGSAFGGTGASGFPTLGTLIARKLADLGHRNKEKNKLKLDDTSNNDGDKVKLGGILLLPYFSFEVPAEYSNSNEIYASPDKFLLNTEAALRYYRGQAEGIFDTIYLLGNQSLGKVGKFSLGRDEQCNEPRFLELYAGLAISHFLSHQPKQTGEAVLISRAKTKETLWSDLPDKIVKQRLINATRFAFAWLADFNERFDAVKENFERDAPQKANWLIKFFQHSKHRKDLPKFNTEIEKTKIINEWCESYLLWLAGLHDSTSSDMSLKLFDRDAFIDSSGQISKIFQNFSRLVIGSNDDKDNIANLKLKLNPLTPSDLGVVGLARALYKQCDKG